MFVLALSCLYREVCDVEAGRPAAWWTGRNGARKLEQLAPQPGDVTVQVREIGGQESTQESIQTGRQADRQAFK